MSEEKPAMSRWRMAETVEVDAAQLTPDNLDELWQAFESKPHYDADRNVDGLAIYADHGREVALFGEWVCRRVDDGLPFTLGDAEFRKQYTQAVAAHVANPTAADYDSAAEVMRLRDEADRERAARLHMAGERDEARSDFRRLRGVLLEGGQSDAAVRKRCLAIIQTTPCQAEPQPAPELAAAMGKARELREVVVDMLTAFSVTGSGHSARVGQVQIAKWRKRAGLDA